MVREAASRREPHGGPDRVDRRAAQRAALIEAAIRVIRRDGPSASMEQMAVEAGVSKPILYRHFHDRAGLVAAIGEHTFARVSDALEGALRAGVTPREVVAAMIDAYLRFIESDPDVYRFLVHRTIAETVDPAAVLGNYISRTGSRVAAVLGDRLRAIGADPVAAEPWAFGIVGMVHAAGDWWLEQGTLTRGRLCEHLTSLVADGLPDGPGERPPDSRRPGTVGGAGVAVTLADVVVPPPARHADRRRTS